VAEVQYETDGLMCEVHVLEEAAGTMFYTTVRMEMESGLAQGPRNAKMEHKLLHEDRLLGIDGSMPQATEDMLQTAKEDFVR
jgi:hypothetical protein